jgi:hypothetical protein
MCLYEFIIIYQGGLYQIATKKIKTLDKMQLKYKESNFVMHIINK